MIKLYTPGRPVESRDVLHSFVHDTAIPAFVSIAICGLALAVGAFALRGFHVVGFRDGQIARKVK
jgi:hypothetical protein